MITTLNVETLSKDLNDIGWVPYTAHRSVVMLDELNNILTMDEQNFTAMSEEEQVKRIAHLAVTLPTQLGIARSLRADHALYTAAGWYIQYRRAPDQEVRHATQFALFNLEEKEFSEIPLDPYGIGVPEGVSIQLPESEGRRPTFNSVLPSQVHLFGLTPQSEVGHFAMHVLEPDRYVNELSWIYTMIAETEESRTGKRLRTGSKHHNKKRHSRKPKKRR